MAVIAQSHRPPAAVPSGPAGLLRRVEFRAMGTRCEIQFVTDSETQAAAYERALRMAEKAHAALGCQGVTRSDFRYDDINDLLVLLEVNTQPGMTPTSLAPEQAAHTGVAFDALVLWIVEDAYARGSAGGRAL